MSDKTYWIGDDRDNKSVCIKRGLYVKGDEIPAEDVAQELLDEWKKKGLIAVGDQAAPVVIIDTQAVTNLKIEIASLKRDVDRIPGLEREVSDLQKAAEKSKGGSKAKAAKAKDARIKELETDNQEKAALIDKQIDEIKGLKSDLEEATAPDKGGDGADDDKTDKPDDSGAGPGGSE